MKIVNKCVVLLFTLWSVQGLDGNDGNIFSDNSNSPAPESVSAESVGNSIARESFSGNNNRYNQRLAERACQGYIQLANGAIRREIFNGRRSNIDEFPWMATLGTRRGNYISFNCGGSIVSRYFILTAAHCLRDGDPNFIRVGTNMRFSNDGTDLDVVRVIRHPFYSQRTTKNDIALIQVRQQIPFNQKIRPACLRTDLSDVSSDIPLIATGWGQTETGRSSNSLLKTSIKTTPFARCQLDWSVDRGQYCAHDPTQRSDTCAGDSGGPLQLVTNDSPLASIVGVTSFGKGCAKEKPGVYARVAYYLDWIEPYLWYDPK